MKSLASLAACVSLATAALLAPALTATAGAEDAPVTITETVTYKQEAERVISEAALPENQKVKLRALMQALPDDADQRVAALNAKLGTDSVWSEIALSVINPADYVCEATPLRAWAAQQRESWGLLGEILVMLLPLADLPTYDALLFGSDTKANTYGVNGEYTSLLTAQKKDLREFWNIEQGEIELRPMHGSDVYSSPERLGRTLDVLYGPGTGEVYAPLFLELMASVPGFQMGATPLFSFNAFALDPTDSPEFQALGVTKKMIVMGDGIMAGLAGIGLDPKVGPRSILAHEYGHQVQFVKHLFDYPLTGAEATRRTELMADAFATYFMVHARGEALNTTRTLDDQKAFFNVGDCSFSSASHHGTPNQRYNSAAWAVSVVKEAANRGITTQLSGAEFAAKFDAKLPELVAPDAP